MPIVNPNQIRIDALTAADLQDFIRLTKAYFQELDLVPEFYGSDQDLTAPLISYAQPRGGFWLARETDRAQPSGMVGVLPLARKTCELKRLYVIPEKRGQGMGFALLKQAMQFARQAEYLEMLQALHHDQTTALSLSRAAGFIPCARFNENRHAGIFLTYKFSSGE